jgi:MarR family transcriptional regulator, lower aerobic nicotinate degradation pathway regulator
MWALPSWQLNQAASRANKLVGEAFGRPGIKRSYGVLAGIEEFGPQSQAALSRMLGIDRSDIVSTLNELERDGLAVREPDVHDRRRNAIRITPAGTAALRALDEDVNRAQDALLEPLTAAERAQLSALLQRLLTHHHGWRPVVDHNG